MNLLNKKALKDFLGELPLTAELYWQFRQNGRPLSESFSLRRTQKRLPEWCAVARQYAEHARNQPEYAPQRVLIFATLRYWIEHAALLGLALAGQGHEVTLAYLPYANWRKAMNRFDLRRQNVYARSVLEATAPALTSLSLLDLKNPAQLPDALEQAIQEVSERDVQYTLQVEAVDTHSELYRLRLARNRQAAQLCLAWLRDNRPEVVLTPNGSILEMGAVYQVSRYLGIPVVTYEFGEQRQRIWLAQNAEVMRQETETMWAARQSQALSPGEWEQVRALFASRQRADLWENFSRRWQGLPSQGGENVRAELGLDKRPVVLLAANVIGDSLTLGRQVFTASMTEWLQRSVAFFARQEGVQLVVRIHPGERYTQGPSVADVVRAVLPDLPGHIHLVPADAPVNTYDLIEIADLGLVYTTTVGMEMAISGVPVIVSGQTHYRGKGFTWDPDSWEAYTALLEASLESAGSPRLSQEQVELAWQYAYHFFFDFPQPFPWHLLHFWEELKTWSLERVLSAEGQAEFGAAFGYLLGEPLTWEARHEMASHQAASAGMDHANEH